MVVCTKNEKAQKRQITLTFSLLTMRPKHLLLSAILLAAAALPAQEDAEQQPVSTGMYLMNIYDLNVSEYTFYADFYLWFKWRGECDPMNIEFVNAVEKWAFTGTPFHEETVEKPDGSLYNGMRAEGRFYHSFDLRRFPLDRHDIDIRIENVEYPLEELVYQADTMQSLFRKDFVIPGWRIAGARIDTHSNFYDTDFGEPETSGSSFSNFTYKLTIARPLSYFLLKLMLPLLVVIVASLGGLVIHPGYMDARISLPIGGLLSCVFLQQSYSSALPDVGYMVLMDKIYLLSYILIALVMLRVIKTGNIVKRRRKEAEPLVLLKKDRRLAGLLLTAFLLGVAALVRWA